MRAGNVGWASFPFGYRPASRRREPPPTSFHLDLAETFLGMPLLTALYGRVGSARMGKTRLGAAVLGDGHGRIISSNPIGNSTRVIGHGYCKPRRHDLPHQPRRLPDVAGHGPDRPAIGQRRPAAMGQVPDYHAGRLGGDRGRASLGQRQALAALRAARRPTHPAHMAGLNIQKTDNLIRGKRRCRFFLNLNRNLNLDPSEIMIKSKIKIKIFPQHHFPPKFANRGGRIRNSEKKVKGK